jgi:putative transcriptional regulator
MSADEVNRRTAVPIVINVDSALLRWQAKYNKRMSYAELAEQVGISVPTIYRLKSGEVTKPDLRVLNKLCKVLECEPADLLRRFETARFGSEDPQQTYEERIKLIKGIEEAEESAE